MNIREATLNDKISIDQIYNTYWNHNEYPDFLNRKVFPGSFVVEEENRIILVGGIKTIAEAVIITDKSFSTRDRQHALLQALGLSIHLTKDLGFNEMHVFVNSDEPYVKHLQKFGFRLMSDRLLVLELPANG